MKIAVVGCGYVADSYAKTLANYPELELVGAYDTMGETLSRLVGLGRAFAHPRGARWHCDL
jgi:predicted dehydrogenase